MKNKVIIICSMLVVLAVGFLYTINNRVIADDKDGKKDCSSSCTKTTGSSSSTSTESKSGCSSDKKMSNNTGTDNPNNYAVYEFVTDKISCDACKSGISNNLMGVAGVKEVSYGETDAVSKMTNVKVFYTDKETTPELISTSVKENNLECDMSKCGDETKCKKNNKTEKKS